MFRSAQFSAKHSYTFSAYRSSYATLPQQLPTTDSIERPRRGFLSDPLSVEKKRRKSRDTEDSIKRNEVGVQLLSRRLHRQIFKNVSFPHPEPRFVRIAKDHLEMHGLDPNSGSVLPNISFTLPPLQGHTIDQHFHRIGVGAAHPWSGLAVSLMEAQLPPLPEHWEIQAGWTKYYYRSDGSSFSEHVDFPSHGGNPETMLVFDVETMPEYYPYAVLACAASPNGWYSWISPWLLDQRADPTQLIPLGDPNVARIIVGHGVSYDRARIREEYGLSGSRTRFLDTMALHVAVKGISSHQRPAWMKHRKSKVEERELAAQAEEAVVALLHETKSRQATEQDGKKREELCAMRATIEESLLLSTAQSEDAREEAESKTWEDITSANSLADVARLHCGIEMDKDARNDFMECKPAEILSNVQDYLNYCANDVSVTHRVYAKVLPEFLKSSPSPVSFSGILTMGSSFLTVNEGWERYLEDAERTYRTLEEGVKRRLVNLAIAARNMVENEQWRDDVWLRQLDWTPKVAKKSRGIGISEAVADKTLVPAWYKELLSLGPFSTNIVNRILPLLLKLSLDGHCPRYSVKEKWHLVIDGQVVRPPVPGKSKVLSLLGKSNGLHMLQSARMTTDHHELALALANGDRSDRLSRWILSLAEELSRSPSSATSDDPWLEQLDWTLVENASTGSPKLNLSKPPQVLWPKWYWDLTRPKKDLPAGTIDITPRTRIAPLLLRLSWQSWPLFHSREHGWVYRVGPSAAYTTRQTPLDFHHPADEALQVLALHEGFVFYKLPHKDGETANVGSPLAKTFVKYAQDGTLTSPGDEARGALDMNAQCSYWISARDRVMKQMVVWQQEGLDMGLRVGSAPGSKAGIILPQVITMGTVTRRAIERTWLTASNAKKNRVGSELKAMVRAPPGYAIVGADVDSEELWISSAMGDAQFGMHGATAIGWMTLEGTKAAGTDLHSKTASILGLSRDQAKVFNYSRIYGAGMRHAMQLLLQANADMLPEQAQRLAEQLYASTKGKNTQRTDVFGRKFWFGGSESFVFNKLEEIALSEQPKTPALGCGITHALSKKYLPAGFGANYMTSRINWVVQSSGVDYLHLVIVSMEHLIQTYAIDARYLISVHDELRYLVAEQDRYRAALALQIANIWTRCLFAYRLGMDDLPQGVAFFSAVDVDSVLRKEADMPCVTPSHPTPIPPGESLSIEEVLARTGGTLWADGRPMGEPMEEEDAAQKWEPLVGYTPPDCLQHRADSATWLRAQATDSIAEIKHLAQVESGVTFGGSVGNGRTRMMRRRKSSVALGPAPEPDEKASEWAEVLQHAMRRLKLR
ncbi:DNA polymerase family A-domain-containing protein [Russula earlei]|uniref:DNA polymerase family A-domain-containing protein n=1 Tax=Russula earlei TaxID=71964 RepID=A0ACC0UJ20_9AGAM|nr:DNA polymerase family A-domain-containing protein [Russula earlei]